jgi:aspartate carbamoyltransferase catalytic subunit
MRFSATPIFRIDLISSEENMNFYGADIVSVKQFDIDALETLFTLARRVKPIAKGEEKCKVLDGYILGNLFFEPSTRTRMSFASAFMRLGGQVNSTTGMSTSSMAKGETLADTITMIQSYCDLIVMRHSIVGAAQEAADFSNIPVINAGDGAGEHPTQALQDLFTILEERSEKGIENSTIAMVGDLKFGRCPNSLASLLSLYSGIRFIFIAPPQLQMPDAFVENIRAKGFEVIQTEDLESGLKEADVIYWTRIQDERIENKEILDGVKDKFFLNREKFRLACKQDATILHPLPRIGELDVDLDSLPNAAYFRQAANSILVRMALLLLVLGKDKELN